VIEFLFEARQRREERKDSIMEDKIFETKIIKAQVPNTCVYTPSVQMDVGPGLFIRWYESCSSCRLLYGFHALAGAG